MTPDLIYCNIRCHAQPYAHGYVYSRSAFAIAYDVICEYENAQKDVSLCYTLYYDTFWTSVDSAV